MMRPNSLSFRLSASAAAISLVFLVIAGLLLLYIFKVAVERNFDSRLQAILDGLLASVELNESNAPIINAELADTRFRLPSSGWYWLVVPTSGEKSKGLSSDSLETGLELPDLKDIERNTAGVAKLYVTEPSGRKLRVIEQKYNLFGNNHFSFIVTGDFREVEDEVAIFRNTLIAVLFFFGVGLLAAILFQVRYGLRPLRRLKREVAAIREGSAEYLGGEYPEEIEPISYELNLLIKNNAAIIDRARTQVGNLAHALKTPLSVLTNEAQLHPGELSRKVDQQTNVMRDQVSMYLDRARRAAMAQSLGTATTDVRDVIDSISRALLKIHAEREIAFEVKCPEGAKVRVDRQDLEEMLGNLLDNAFKWANKKIYADVKIVDLDSNDGRNWLMISVGDDGPGLKPEQREDALCRGKRLDESKPGSGLGLSIVCETVGMYNGDFDLTDSRFGGLSSNLTLPAVS